MTGDECFFLESRIYLKHFFYFYVFIHYVLLNYLLIELENIKQMLIVKKYNFVTGVYKKKCLEAIFSIIETTYSGYLFVTKIIDKVQ